LPISDPASRTPGFGDPLSRDGFDASAFRSAAIVVGIHIEAAKSGVVADPAAFAHLKRLMNSRANSVVLHEFYFDGLEPKSVDPEPKLRSAIEQRFGSLDKWSADFVASAKEAAGWAMLVKHPVNGKLYNVVSDEHAMGVLWMARPIIVIDTYEHAFYIDYQNRKADDVEKFMTHIDWTESGRRFGHS
jgi:Fe-Mn family superoxide dismutase